MRFLTDEHIPSALTRQLQRKYSERVDVLRVVDAGLAGASDPEILEWAARDNRILVTQDKATLTDFGYERINEGRPMPGVIAITRRFSIGDLLEELALIIECGTMDDFERKVFYIPLS
ncbi:MAG TPA: DUF5615 family PIN-like protein [Meiothermus sp.]|nr:DUF5615 family PIN-like protein [Meiothermus sp.]